MILSLFVGIFLLLALIKASASGSDSSASSLKLIALKSPFKIEDKSTSEEKKYKVLLDDSKTKHFLFQLSNEGLLNADILSDFAGTLVFFSCNLNKSSLGQPVDINKINFNKNPNFDKGSMISVLYSASILDLNALSSIKLSFPY